MPQVPQYDRQVAPKNTPLPYMNLNSEGAFGETVYKAQANFGAALGNIADSLDKIQTRIDNTKLVELTNKTNEWEQTNLYDKENGYLYKSGKDAYGQSQNLLQDYDKFMSDYISKSNLRPEAKQKAMATVSSMRNRISQTVTAHDYKQGVVWSNTEGDSAKEYYMSNAINMRNNPEEIAKSLMSGYQIIEWQGEIQNKDDAQIRADKIKFRSDLHQGVLNSLIADGSLKAGEYLEQHKSEIDPNKLPQYISAVKNNEINYTARNNAMSLVGLPLEDAYASINSIDDPQMRSATMREYNLFTNQMEAVQREKNNQFMSEFSNMLADTIAKGGDPNELKREILKTDLPFDVKQKQIDFINDSIELGQEANLWCDKEALDELMHTDFETFQKTDLSKYALTKSEREHYLQEQKKIREYSTNDQLRDAVKKMDTFFYPNNDNLNSNVYKDELIGLLARIERLQGKAFDIDNFDEGSLNALIEGFKYKADMMPAELQSFGIKDFKNIDETKELYMRAKNVAEVQDRVARSYVAFKNQNKREPEAHEVYDIVLQEYMNVAREQHQKKQIKVNAQIQMQKDINSVQIKKSGYTKVLTYFEEKTIPALENSTGVKMKITSTYRSTGKYGHEKGLKADAFPVNPTPENIIKSAEYLLASPEVEVLFTSNPVVYQRFKGHPKLQYEQAKKYDERPEVKKAGINHKNHFDIKLTSKFGGTEQIKPASIKSAQTNLIARK